MPDRSLLLLPLALALMSPPAWCRADPGAPAPLEHLGSRGLLGGAAGGAWVPGARVARAAERATYRLYSLAGPVGEAKATGLRGGDGPCSDLQLVALPDPTPASATVALAAPWNAVPRPVRAEPTSSKVYLEAARQLLEEKGTRGARPSIQQLLRADLDGDGKDEVLMVAANLGKADGGATGRREHPFVALRRLVGDAVRTDVIAGSFTHGGEDASAACEYVVAGILDANGDGRMELLLEERCPAQDAFSVQLYELLPGGPRRVDAVQCGCGG